MAGIILKFKKPINKEIKAKDVIKLSQELGKLGYEMFASEGKDSDYPIEKYPVNFLITSTDNIDSFNKVFSKLEKKLKIEGIFVSEENPSYQFIHNVSTDYKIE